MKAYTLSSGWTRSNTGHHYHGWRIRVVTATVDGKGPMYWIYNRHGRYSATGSYNDSVSFRSLAKAKRFVEKMVRSQVRYVPIEGMMKRKPCPYKNIACAILCPRRDLRRGECTECYATARRCQ